MENRKSEEKKAWMIAAAALISVIVGFAAMMLIDECTVHYPSEGMYMRPSWGGMRVLSPSMAEAFYSPAGTGYSLMAIMLTVFTPLLIWICKEQWKHMVVIIVSLMVAFVTVITLNEKDIVTSEFGSMLVMVAAMAAVSSPFFIWLDWIPQDGKKKNLRTFCEEFQVFKRTKKAVKTTAQVLAVILVWYSIAIGLYLAGEAPEAHGLIGILLQCAGSLMILLPILIFIP